MSIFDRVAHSIPQGSLVSLYRRRVSGFLNESPTRLLPRIRHARKFLSPTTSLSTMKQRFSSLDVKVIPRNLLERNKTLTGLRSSRRSWPRSWSTSGCLTSTTCHRYVQFPLYGKNELLLITTSSASSYSSFPSQTTADNSSSTPASALMSPSTPARPRLPLRLS